jgi:hypothetical protein
MLILFAVISSPALVGHIAVEPHMPNIDRFNCMYQGGSRLTLTLFFLQKEYTCQKCQTLTPFQNILPLHYHIFPLSWQVTDAHSIKGFILTLPLQGFLHLWEDTKVTWTHVRAVGRTFQFPTVTMPKGLALVCPHGSESEEAPLMKCRSVRDDAPVLCTGSVTSWNCTVEDGAIDITNHKERHCDPTGFLVNILQMWRVWMVPFVQLPFQFRLVCLHPGLVKGKDTA